MFSTVWSTPASGTPEIRVPRTFWRDTALALRRQQAALLGLALVGLVVLAAVVGIVATPESANRSNLAQRLTAPGLQHVLGTDISGRDILQRVLLGAPLSLAVGVVAVAIGSLLGALHGLVAGVRGVLVGAISMRVADRRRAVPTLLYRLAILA